MKYAYKLCDHCKEMIRRFNRAEAKRRRKQGLPLGGRPRKRLDAKVIERLRTGTLTLEQAAKKLGVSSITVRRRLHEMTSSTARKAS